MSVSISAEYWNEMHVPLDCYFMTSGYSRQAAFSFKDFLFICLQGSLESSLGIGNSVVLMQCIKFVFRALDSL